MSNKLIFKKQNVPQANSINNAGGKAYKLSSKQALALFAATGCFNDTFYASAEAQLNDVLRLAKDVDPNFVAKIAIFSRNSSFMRDMPAFLLAYLTTVDLALVEQIFDRVIDNGKMLRTFCQIIRSGVVGRKSFGTRPKNLIQKWINNRGAPSLFWDSIGNNPSMGDVIKMVHPKPWDQEQNAMFAYLSGHKYDLKLLPAIVQQYETWKKGEAELPNIDMRLLTAAKLSEKDWKLIAQRANWHTTRMNLETFMRHGVMKDPLLVRTIAQRLSDPAEIKKAKIFPYQLLTTFQTVERSGAMPREITNALQDAMEHATENIPSIDGDVHIFPDVSGSMQHSVTGIRHGATSATRCIDVAALVAASVLRKNPNANIRPFNGAVVDVRLNPRDSVMTNAVKLAAIGGGSTYCPAPLNELIAKGTKGDLIIYISDNESWINGNGGFGQRSKKGTELAESWAKFRKSNANAKMACIDVTSGTTAQALDDSSVMNIGGFSDNVFLCLANFINGGRDNWVDIIEESIRL